MSVHASHAPMIKAYLLNYVGGHGLLAGPAQGELIPFIRRTEALYAAYPEIARGELLHQEVKSDSTNVVAVAYGTTMEMVIAVASLSPGPLETTLWIPGMGSVLFDRLEGHHVPLAGGLAWMDLPGYAQLAFELR
jgi:hypothetical protein